MIVRRSRAVLLLLVLLAVGGLLVASRQEQKCPPLVIVGPLEPQQHVFGPIQKGMTRKQITDLLGQPIRPRETWGEADKRGAFDPIQTDLFAGVYAEVGWYGDDKVAYAAVWFDKFSPTYGRELKALLRINGKQMLLSKSLTFDEAQKPAFAASLGLKSGDISIHDHLIHIKTKGSELVTLEFARPSGELLYVYQHF